MMMIFSNLCWLRSWPLQPLKHIRGFVRTPGTPSFYTSQMCNFHTWIAINTTLTCDFIPLASSYHSISGGNYLAMYNSPLNWWKIHLYNAETCMYMIRYWTSTNIMWSKLHITWSWKSQTICTVLRTCQHTVTLSYTSMHGGWWVQRRKIWMKKKRPQARIWSMQPYNYIYIATHDTTRNSR